MSASGNLKPLPFLIGALYDAGHEDLDQVFSVISSLIARHEFETPSALVDLLDSSGRPSDEMEGERKKLKKEVHVECRAYKLDECARWHDWTSVLGIRAKGLRCLNMHYNNTVNVFWKGAI